MVTDKSSIIQIIGGLMKNPLLLSDTKYSITPEDFSTSFEKIIYGAIYNLYLNGVEKISIIDIDNYLKNIDGVYQLFLNNNGIEYLQDCEEISVDNNFDYYYNKLKKFNLLNSLEKEGFNIDNIYPSSIMDKDYDKKIDNFEKATIKDIVDCYKLKLSALEASYQCIGEIKEGTAASGLRGLLEQLKEEPDIGVPLQGKIYNTAVRGARLGKYYVRSADSGVGKTKSMIGEATGIAIPFTFNIETWQWELTGANSRVLYIGTEQELEEIQTQILSYLTGFNEEKILYNLYTEEEEIVVKQAIEIIEMFEDNFIIIQIPNPDIKSIKAEVRKQVLQKNVQYVFYDYIFNSPALISEFKDAHLREDVILMMLSTALKDLAVELNVFMQTSTQVTIAENEKRGPKTKASIRSAKSIADKADVGCVLSRVEQDDLRVLSGTGGYCGIQPNQVLDIYKLRRGKYNNVRIWSYFDAGTCRRKDLFITNNNIEEVKDFQVLEYNIDFSGDMTELIDNLEKLNNINEKIKPQVREEIKEIIEEPIIEEDKKGWSGLF